MKSVTQGFSQPYKEPTSGSMARLRTISTGTVRLIPGTDCVNWQIDGLGLVNSRNMAFLNDKTFNNRSLGMPAETPPKNFSEVYIAAEQSITAVTTEDDHVLSISFRPETGADYELGSYCIRGKCFVSLRRIEASLDKNKISYTAEKFSVVGLCR
jgi:hypothetical protein